MFRPPYLVVHVILQSVGIDRHFLPEVPYKHQAGIVRGSPIRGIPGEDGSPAVDTNRVVHDGVGQERVGAMGNRLRTVPATADNQHYKQKGELVFYHIGLIQSIPLNKNTNKAAGTRKQRLLILKRKILYVDISSD
jgi:hypothetical protein